NVKAIRTSNWELDISVNGAHNTNIISNFYHLKSGNITEWNNSINYEGVSVWSYEGGNYGQMEVNANGSIAFQIDPETGYPIITNGTKPSVTNGNFDNGNATNLMPHTFNIASYQYFYDIASRVSRGHI